MIRDFHGYQQHQETFEVPNKKTDGFKKQKRWMFYIAGFGVIDCLTGDCEARILRSDGTTEIIPHG